MHRAAVFTKRTISHSYIQILFPYGSVSKEQIFHLPRWSSRKRSTETSIFESILILQKFLRLLYEGAIACRKVTMPRVER